MTENWRKIPRFNDYEVSSTGRVRSFKWGKVRMLKQSPDKLGYLLVKLYVDGQATMRRVHRLVLLSFVGQSDLDTNHIDGVKDNNVLENLEYCTESENAIHAHRVLKRNFGFRAGNKLASKLNEPKRLEILAISKHGNMYQKEIASYYNMTQSGVSQLLEGEKNERQKL